MYTSSPNVISANTHKGNPHPLSQPIKTAHTEDCKIVNTVKELYLSGTTQQ